MEQPKVYFSTCVQFQSSDRNQFILLFPRIASDDYTSLTNAELTFVPATTEQCTLITIDLDTVVENTEIFSVQLGTRDQDVILFPTTASILILDDDSEFFLYIFVLRLMYAPH